MHNALRFHACKKHTQNRNCHTEKQADKPVRTFVFFHLASPRYLQKFVFIIADFIRFFNCFCRGLKVTLFHNYVLFHILDTAFFTGKNRTEMYLFQCISIRFIITLLIKPCLIFTDYSASVSSAVSSAVSASAAAVSSASSAASASPVSASSLSSNGITAPSYFSLIKSLISSDFYTSTRALILSLFSFPSFTAITFTYVFAASESEVSYASASLDTE